MADQPHTVPSWASVLALRQAMLLRSAQRWGRQLSKSMAGADEQDTFLGRLRLGVSATTGLPSVVCNLVVAYASEWAAAQQGWLTAT